MTKLGSVSEIVSGFNVARSLLVKGIEGTRMPILSMTSIE